MDFPEGEFTVFWCKGCGGPIGTKESPPNSIGANHSDEPLRGRRRVQQRLPRFLSLIYIAQKVNWRTFFCKIDRLTVLVKMTVLNSERKTVKKDEASMKDVLFR